MKFPLDILEVNYLPSQAILEQKQQYVTELTEKVKGAVAGVLVDYKGITVADDTKLRKELREAGVEYTVVKNTMLHLAAQNVGYEELDPVLNGTTALALSTEDHVAAARILSKFAETHKNFKIKAGFIEGKVIDLAEIEKLAKLPTRENLLCMVLYALNGNISGLARALQAIVDKKNEEAPAE